MNRLVIALIAATLIGAAVISSALWTFADSERDLHEAALRESLVRMATAMERGTSYPMLNALAFEAAAQAKLALDLDAKKKERVARAIDRTYAALAIWRTKIFCGLKTYCPIEIAQLRAIGFVKDSDSPDHIYEIRDAMSYDQDLVLKTFRAADADVAAAISVLQAK